MNINRHNYEEYFILYMDNELGINERRQLEEFVQKHPDLKEELDVLLQYKLVPDTSILFNGKEELMIHDASSITLDNYEEWLVLYLDNELTAKQKKTVEKFIEDYPAIKEELIVLQRTKLQPEKIIFANKETLFRKTADRPVIAMRWWRVAAAVLIFAIGLTTFVLRNKKSPVDSGIVTTPKIEQKINKENPVVNNNNGEKKKDQQPEIANATQQTNAAASKQTNNNITVKRNNVIIKKLPHNLPPVQREEPIIVDNNNQKPSNNLPTPLNNSIIKNNESNNGNAKVNISNETIKPKETIGEAVTPNPSQPSQVVYNPSDNGKKGKLRGLLRKVTRTFEKNTNIDATEDEDRVLIGGLALKLK